MDSTGLHLPGSHSLGFVAERLIEQSEATQDFETGKLCRTSIENIFNKVRTVAAKWYLAGGAATGHNVTTRVAASLVGATPESKPRGRHDLSQRPPRACGEGAAARTDVQALVGAQRSGKGAPTN